MDEKSTWRLTWHQVDNAPWSTSYCIKPIKKSWVCGKQLNFHWLLNILYRHDGLPDYLLFGLCMKYVVGPQYGMWSLYTELEAPLIVELDLCFP
jgi:hypothetical protein